VTPRKQKKKTPHLDGWTFFSITTNLFIPCGKCKKKPKEMFYKQKLIEGSNIPQTEALCINCSGI